MNKNNASSTNLLKKWWPKGPRTSRDLHIQLPIEQLCCFSSPPNFCRRNETKKNGAFAKCHKGTAVCKLRSIQEVFPQLCDYLVTSWWFQPNWIISPGRDEHRKSLKTPTSYCWWFWILPQPPSWDVWKPKTTGINKLPNSTGVLSDFFHQKYERLKTLC